MSLFKLTLRNLLHRRFLSLLTVCAVAVTVAFIVLLSLSRQSVEQGAKKGYGPFDLVIGAAGSETQLVLNTFIISVLRQAISRLLFWIKWSRIRMWIRPLR